MITLHYFAGVRELTGTSEEKFRFSGNTITQLKDRLAEKYPGFEANSVQFAVNEEYALPGDLLSDGDIVAIIPPVSGG